MFIQNGTAVTSLSCVINTFSRKGRFTTCRICIVIWIVILSSYSKIYHDQELQTMFFCRLRSEALLFPYTRLGLGFSNHLMTGTPPFTTNLGNQTNPSCRISTMQRFRRALQMYAILTLSLRWLCPESDCDTYDRQSDTFGLPVVIVYTRLIAQMLRTYASMCDC